MVEFEIAYRYHGHPDRSDWRFFQAAVREIWAATGPLQ